MVGAVLGGRFAADAEWPLCLESFESSDWLEEDLRRIARVVDPEEPAVVEFVRETVSEENVGAYNIGQVCDLFDRLIGDWSYVPDPRIGDAFVPPWVSLLTLSGDCDDFAVVLASCILALGGCSEIIFVDEGLFGHVYALLYVGEGAVHIARLRGYLRGRYSTAVSAARFCRDAAGGLWLPLDWVDAHPGGRRWSDTATVTACALTDLCGGADRAVPAVPNFSEE